MADHTHDPDEPLLDTEVTDVRWLYHADYYDGPISGMVTSAATGPVWAQMIQQCWGYSDDDDDESETVCGWTRRYKLIQLTPEAAAEEAERHDWFRRCVGTHTDYNEHGRRDHGGVLPQTSWHDFYDRYPHTGERHGPDDVVVGWFQR